MSAAGYLLGRELRTFKLQASTSVILMTSFSSWEQIRLSGDALHLKERDAWFKPRIEFFRECAVSHVVAICSIDRQ